MGVREGMLALLLTGPTHGYRLKSRFDEATGGSWPLNVGQVYTTLDRLERDGLVAVTSGPDRTVYDLTSDGRAAIGQWWQASGSTDTSPRDELIVKVLLAVSLDSRQALDVITTQRDHLLDLLREYRQRELTVTGKKLMARLAADAVMVRAESDLRWLDLCEERLLAELRRPAPGMTS